MARLRREAARSGRTMSELVETALRGLLQSRPANAELAPLPSFDSGGALVDITDRDELYRAMEGRQLFVVDTNVLVYAADVRAAEHARCRALVERWRQRSAAWFLTWGICYEFLRVVTHPRVLRHPWAARDAHAFLEAVVESPGLEILTQTDRHRDILGEIVRDLPTVAGNLWHDAETAALMREHGVRRICTRDTDFHRFPFLEPVDPLTAEP